MPTPDSKSDPRQESSQSTPERGKPRIRRLMQWLNAVAGEAINKPAQSAVALTAFGIIVGSILRMTLSGHSGPAPAGASIERGAYTRPEALDPKSRQGSNMVPATKTVPAKPPRVVPEEAGDDLFRSEPWMENVVPSGDIDR